MKKKIYLFNLLIGLFFAPFAVAEYECEPTPQMFLGNSYKPITQTSTELGKGFHVRGTVFSAVDCMQIPSAKIQYWQAGKNGKYEDRFYAQQVANEKGQFGFETEYPGTNPPHIHFIITAPGYKTLTTQWVSKGFRDRVTLYLTMEPVK